MVRIKDILDMLHPDVISVKVDAPINMLRKNYRLSKYVADDFRDCLNIVVGFFQSCYSEWLDTDVVMPYELAVAKVKELLSKKGGFAQAVKNAMRGREGGLVGALDSIAEALKEEGTAQYIEGVITHFVNPMDFDLKMGLAEEYLDRYARHVLSGEELLCPEELAANFEYIIKFHVKWVVSYRQTMT